MSQSARKHVSQMTEREKDRLINLLMAVPYWKAANHMERRLKQRRGKLRDAREVIFQGDLIEYHNKNGSHRALLRSNELIRGRVMCCVFEIDTCRLITQYWNRPENTHENLNMSLYDETIDILELLRN